MARAERDTANRPSCKTASGRVVYGGGGVYPDIVLPESDPTPVWLSRVYEQSLLLRWVSGHVADQGGAYASVEALAATPDVAPGAVASFRTFSASQGVPLPDGEDADRLLRRAILLRVADAKWGDAGYYRIQAALDRDIALATQAFARAREILR